jgi:hypothetical protein
LRKRMTKLNGGNGRHARAGEEHCLSSRVTARYILGHLNVAKSEARTNDAGSFDKLRMTTVDTQRYFFAAMTPRHTDAALLVVGHGSTVNPGV